MVLFNWPTKRERKAREEGREEMLEIVLKEARERGTISLTNGEVIEVRVIRKGAPDE